MAILLLFSNDITAITVNLVRVLIVVLVLPVVRHTKEIQEIKTVFI